MVYSIYNEKPCKVGISPDLYHSVHWLFFTNVICDWQRLIFVVFCLFLLFFTDKNISDET